MAEVLATHALTKRYRGKTALDGLTISLEEGHIYGLIGGDGAGKTTLLRILAGLSEPRYTGFVKILCNTKEILCKSSIFFKNQGVLDLRISFISAVFPVPRLSRDPSSSATISLFYVFSPQEFQ